MTTKTTLELSAGLLRRIKALAAMQGRSMKDLVTEALEDKLARQSDAPSTPTGWRAAFGKAKPAAIAEVDRSLRDFDQVDPKDWD